MFNCTTDIYNKNKSNACILFPKEIKKETIYLNTAYTTLKRFVKQLIHFMNASMVIYKI